MKALDARTHMYERARRPLHGHGGYLCLVDVGIMEKEPKDEVDLALVIFYIIGTCHNLYRLRRRKHHRSSSTDRSSRRSLNHPCVVSLIQCCGVLFHMVDVVRSPTMSHTQSLRLVGSVLAASMGPLSIVSPWVFKVGRLSLSRV